MQSSTKLNKKVKLTMKFFHGQNILYASLTFGKFLCLSLLLFMIIKALDHNSVDFYVSTILFGAGFVIEFILVFFNCILLDGIRKQTTRNFIILATLSLTANFSLTLSSIVFGPFDSTNVVALIFVIYFFLTDIVKRSIYKKKKLLKIVFENKKIVFINIILETLFLISFLIASLIKAHLKKFDQDIIFSSLFIFFIFYLNATRFVIAFACLNKRGSTHKEHEDFKKITEISFPRNTSSLNIGPINRYDTSLKEQSNQSKWTLKLDPGSEFSLQEIACRKLSDLKKPPQFLANIGSEILNFPDDNLNENKTQKIDAISSNININSNKIYQFKETETISSFWQYLPSIIDDGIAIFYSEEIITTNITFTKYIQNLLDSCISYDPLSVGWQNIFSKIDLIPVFANNSFATNTNLTTLSYELCNIMNYQIQDMHTELQAKFLATSKPNNYEICIYKKPTILDKSYTVLKIVKVVNNYNQTTKKPLTKIEQLIFFHRARQMQYPLNYFISCLRIAKPELSFTSYQHLKCSSKLFTFALNALLKVGLVTNFQKIECNPDHFSIVKIIQNMIKNMHPLVESHELKVNFQNNVLMSQDFVFHDKDIIQIILYHLFLNSLRFTKKGLVTIKISKISQSDDFEISFIDTGVGMPKMQQQKLTEFLHDKNEQIDEICENNGETNVGLDICKKLLSRIHSNEKRKDRIQFETTEGRGSTFTIKIYHKFPTQSQFSSKLSHCIDSENEKSSQFTFQDMQQIDLINEEEDYAGNYTENKAAEFYLTLSSQFNAKFFPTPTSSLTGIEKDCQCPFRVLIADNNELNLISFRMAYLAILKNIQEKQELLISRNGQEGIDIFFNYFEYKKCGSSHCCPIHLVILNYSMPDKIGPLVTFEIREYLSDNISLNKKVHIYGWGEGEGQEFKREFMNAGASGILSKPVKTKELSNILKRFIKFQSKTKLSRHAQSHLFLKFIY